MLTAWINAAKRQWARFSLKHPAWDKFKKSDRVRRWTKHTFINYDRYIMTFFRSSWVRPFEEEPFKPVTSYSWPFYSNARYNREITKFMFSFREESSTNRNINNLMFITGPESSGKSWFLKSNLEKFANVKSGTFLIHVDLGEVNSLNFESFLDLFEAKIVKFLVKHADVKFASVYMTRWEMIVDLLVANHERLYLDVKLNEILRRNIKSDEFLRLGNDQKKELAKFLAEFEDRLPQSTPIVDSLKEILKIISKDRVKVNSQDPQSSSKAMVQAALDLCLTFYRNEEASSCPKENFVGIFRSGLKTTWFLLDLLDLISGFHELNIKDLEYPHLLLVLGNLYAEKAGKLLEIETNEDRPVSWLEALALRQFVKVNRMTSLGGITCQSSWKVEVFTSTLRFMMT